MILWGMLISLITIGTMVILGITSNDSTELALKLIVAILVPLVSIVLLLIVKKIVQK